MSNPSISTVSQLENRIKTTTKTTAYPIAGFKGLELNVRVNASGKIADFRHRYTHPITGKRPYMTLGQYPALTLEQARQAYNDNMALLAQQIDPLEHKTATKQRELKKRQNTLNTFIEEWYQLQLQKNLSQSRYNNIQNNLQPIKDELGNKLVSDITPVMVIEFIDTLQKKNTYKATRVRYTLSNILQRAMIKRVIDRNPAKELQGIFTPHKVEHYCALTDYSDVAILLNDIDSLPASSKHFDKQVLQLLALTFARIGDICSMKWGEIDLDNGLWHLKPAKGKGRDDMMNDITLPLAPQAVAILEYMHTITGGHEYVFFNKRRKHEKFIHHNHVRETLYSPMMNKQGIGKGYRTGRGYYNVHSPHGFRAVAKTNLKRLLKSDPLAHDKIELQMGHKTRDKFGRAYDRWDLLSERKEMITDWANYLDDLKAGKINNVIHFPSNKNHAKTDTKAVND